MGFTNYTHQAIIFSFDYLWNISLTLNQTDPDSPLLYHPHDNQTRICLTYDGCIAHVGPDSVLYSSRDVYDRVLLWRAPLIALVATTTLPTLGFHTQIFTILHLIASPIDTLWSLFYKLDLARRHADWAAENNKDSRFSFAPANTNLPSNSTAHQVDTSISEDSFLSRRGKVQTGLASNKAQQSKELALRKEESPVMRQYDLDVIALIINSYQEWHFGERAQRAILHRFQANLPSEKRETFRSCCASAAAYIAADRVARMLPSFVATLIFFTQLFAGFWKTLDNIEDHPRDSLNRTPHNIAFGALYFWLPFAVLTTAIVGGAQTENSVPRILNRLRNDTDLIFPSDSGADRETRESNSLPELEFSMSKRRIAGGLPTWQPDKFQDWKNNNHLKFFCFTLVLSIFIVGVPSVASIWVSWRTPTEGFGCRSLTQMCFFVSWAINYGLDWILTILIREQPKTDGAVRSQRIYWITFLKDLALTAGAITMLTYTSRGLFNNCNCWTKWFPDHTGGQRYLSFPEEQYVFDVLKHRLQYEFWIVTVVALGIELIVFFLVWIYFRRGHRVLKQRDIDEVLAQEGWGKTMRKKIRDNVKSLFAFLKGKKTKKAVSFAPIEESKEGKKKGRGKGKKKLGTEGTELINLPPPTSSPPPRTDTSGSLEAQTP